MKTTFKSVVICFEDTVTNFDKYMFQKRIFLWYKLLYINENHI